MSFLLFFSSHRHFHLVTESPTTADGSQPVIGKAVAQYQWKARNDNELSFSKNDEIEILEQVEMRWKV